MLNKRRIVLIATVVLISILIVTAVLLLLYEILIEKKIDPSSILRAVLTIIVSVSALVKLKASAPSARIYREVYADIIGSAFAGKKEEKLFMKAIYHFNNNRYENAIKLFEELKNKSITSEEEFAIAVFIALSYDDIGCDEKAIISYSKALDIRSNSTLASNRALCYQRIGRNTDAISSYRLAIETDPQNPIAYNNVAQLYLRECKYEEALIYAKKATEIQNNMHQAFTAQAISYAMLGDTANYEDALRRAVINGANRQAIEEVIESLRFGDLNTDNLII